jgi:hypothetical protein
MVERALSAKYADGDVSDMLRGAGDEETAIMRAALEAAIGDMVRDAERYRFVRDGGRFDTYERIRVSQSVSRLENRTSDRLDAAIDAAIAAHSGTGEGREGGA